MASSSPAKGHGKLRIIAGQWRGRKLQFNAECGIRPTPDRVRETLFNWLQPFINGAACVDLFAGSGALGFEAASRGAGAVSLVEADKRVCAQLDAQAQQFGADNIKVIHQDARAFIKTASAFDIVFIDPPYTTPILSEILEQSTTDCGIFGEGTLVYIESAASKPPSPNGAWQCLHQAQAGDVAYGLYRVC